MLDTDFDKRMFYSPICSEQEIDRILLPQSAQDYLLQERANIIVDHMRFFRVYRNKALSVTDWCFEKSFSTRHYLNVLDSYDDEDKEACSHINFGNMFSNDVNGYAIKHGKWGRFVHLNEALSFYMKFCNLALMDFPCEVPDYIRLNSLRIAIRVFLKNEAMDFLMDPRGIIPHEVARVMLDPIEDELQFIAGHEFGHHLHEHLNDENLKTRAFLNLGDKEYLQPIYSVSQTQEFQADLASVQRPAYDIDTYTKIFGAALLWFISLDLAEFTLNFMSPPITPSSHPPAQDRINNLLENGFFKKSEIDFSVIDKIHQRGSQLKDFLNEDLSLHWDFYEYYGSAYLDAPNTKWRGKELIDRVDYY